VRGGFLNSNGGRRVRTSSLLDSLRYAEEKREGEI